MSSLSERIANLSPEKRELLLKRLEKKQENIIPNTIECQKRNTNIFPLSFAQNRMWFLDRIEQENSAYNISTALRLTGILNVTILKRCLEEIIRRHEILRTTFAIVEEKPVQIINNCPDFPFAIADLQALPEAAKQKEVLLLAKEETKKPFDLQKDLLLRISLIKISSQEHVVLFTMHHIISDGWSLGILIKEIATLYQAFLEGKPSPLPELPIQYADFAVWQREWLQGEVLSTQLDYWHKQLQNVPLLNFPTDYPRPAVTTYKGATQSFEISESLTTAIKALSRQEGVTLFMTLLAAFKALLSRYSHQNDIVVGTPIANRNRAEIEGLIGFFVNTLVLRTNLDGDRSFTELLKRVREVTLGAYTHQDIPFEQLVEVMKVERHLNRHPLFDVMFTLENDSTEELKLPELTLSYIAEERKTAIFDLTLSMTETEQGLAGDIEYSTDLFNESTIKRAIAHFQTLLEAIVANPEQKLSQLPLLTAAEQHQLLREWNNTEVEYPQDRCIHQLFEEQVKQTPDRIAVVFEEQQLTYRELNNRANQLAYYLQKQGIKPEKTVGICVNRSLEMAVAILGVLKAGGAYIPIDPTYPRDRITDILEDAGVEILLTQQHLEAEFQDKIRLVNLDSGWSDIERESTQNYLSHATSENLAYVIYTSGSTGKPKGVAVTHKALVNYTLDIAEQFKLQNTDRVLQFASIGFDVVVEELFPTWSVGATVVLLENHQLISCSEFQQLIAKQQLTVFELPTAYWHQWVSELSQSQATVPSCVRLVIVGGERISPERLKQWQQFNTPLLHVYGLTETTVTSTVYLLNNDTEPVKDGVELAIGRPIANTQIYILDSYLQPVPVGVTGEIYIGGEGIARGYLNRSQLTAQRFIPNLFSHTPGERLYKTGDLGKYRDDGSIEYIGRIDYQVKLRGFRIELGEIESTLNRHPAIATNIVVLREDVPGDRSLVAYVTLESEQIIEVSELRRFIESKLPKYMVPNAFVMLNSLPLTPNGKIDRKALPAPESSQFVTQTEYLVPSTPTQETLAGIWQDILGVERIGIKDNFFELGGHSLLATRVVSQIRQVFQIELPLRSLFEKPTIADLAAEIEQTKQDKLSLESSLVQPISRAQEIPLSFAQQRLWFLAQLEPENPFYNQPSTLRLSGRLNIAVLQQSLKELVRRHEPLRTTFSTTIAGKAIQIINPAGEILLPVVNLEKLNPTTQEREIQKLATQEAERVFNLEQDALLRVTLLRLNPSEHIVLFTTHHIVSDEWSTGILVQEIATLYQAYLEGKPSPLPELPIQYADFALWQREWLTGEVLASQLDYWHKQLQDIPRLNLPTDYPRPAITTYKGATRSFELSESLTTAIKALSQQAGVTLFMTLLAAFKVLLSRSSHQNDVVVGTPIANRNRAEIEGLIGFFVNTLVLRTNLDGDRRFTELLQKVKETTLEAYTHQDIPFEQLVEELKVERHLNRNPLFDVMFTLENGTGEDLKLPGLTLSTISEETNTAVFDLTLSMSETETGFSGTIEYSTELFKEHTIDRMLAHFQTLLEAIVTEPEEKISQLSLLTAAEEQQLLVEWNDTEVEYPQERCIHELFEEQAEKTPDRIAVVFEEQQLTYQELNNRANQLARYLQKQGIKPEKTVGICVNRSLEMAVAILAVLKAGGAYIPIDPNYPSDRITDILEDAGVEILLTQQHLETQFQDKIQLVNLDSGWSEIERESTGNYLDHSTSENLAYVIYTSGSTGKPKGVAVTHQALVNYTLDIAEQFELEKSDRVLQFASIGFDVVIEELFPTWSRGATVVLLENNQLISCSEFQQLIAKQQLTLFELPTAYWHQWVSELYSGGETITSCVRLVIVGGERISSEKLKQWQQLSTPLLHVYGLTETTVTSTVYHLNSNAELAKDKVELAIGRPLANTQIYLLDSHLQPVPIGVAGELYIGGEGIARGYLNRAALTAERFIPNHFSKAPGERLYKTGDLARYQDDGSIEYIGRVDYQVKLRGFRIELGEIESILNRHPAVATSIIVLREDLPGNQSLVAYVTLESEQILEVFELRRYLESKLPKYMVPNAFVMLDSLPLTPNGKIDRKALPAPDPTQLVANTEYVAPTTSLEKMLVGIWQEILGIEQVGVDDNFFELGGHSLLLTQLISKLKHAFQIELPLRILYESPTIASLAEKIESIFQNGLSNVFEKESLIDLNAEAILDSTIFPNAELTKFNLEPNAIFLTGATGFLGAFLLYELLQQTQANIYCLVRSKNRGQGKQKLQNVLESYLIWQESFSQRIIAVPGDLAKPFLGLTEEQFQELATKLDVIYHNGAWVHHLYPYSVLKAANVSGTQEVIRLACQNKTKPIHYISTPDVFSSIGHSGTRLIKEQDSSDREQVPTDGYTQTKWVAEKLIKTAQQRELPVCIYRPGRVSGHSQTGVFNPNDFLHKLTIGCIELRSAPEGELIENIVPVDYVSKAIIYLSRQESSVGEAFHILNPQHDYIDKLIKVAHSFGFSIQQIPYQQWQEKLMNIASTSPNHPLYSLVPFFPAREVESETTDVAELEFDCQNTVKGLVDSSISCPQIDEDLISNYFSCAIQKGLFNPTLLMN